MIKPQLHYYATDSRITAFSSTRHGGVSEGCYAEFNINEYCGDTPDHVRANRSALCDELCISEKSLVVPHQVHGTEVRHIGREFVTLPDNIRRMLIEGVDAVMTDVPGVCVGVSTADCIPVLLHDPVHHAVCAVHAGWRGTVQRIVPKAMAMMNMTFGTNPSELTAIIGPGISLDKFEVGQEVYDAFAEAAFEMGDIARKYEKWHIDLPQANRLSLMSSGVRSENIHLSGICTYTSADDYFSARRLGTDSGRIYNGIMLRQGE